MTEKPSRLGAAIKFADLAASVIKTLAVVIGAGWILFRYLATERSLEQQRLEQLRLANQQATLTLQTQDASQRLRLEELRLTNENARFTLAVQKGQHDLRQKELEASVALQQLLTRKTRHEVGYVEGRRFAYRFLIDSRRERENADGTHLYVVNHGFEIVNTSQRPLEVAVMAIDYFIGTPRDGAPSLITPMGCPRNRWNPESEQPGGLAWKHVGCAASIGEVPARKFGKELQADFGDCHLVRGGPGTGVLQPLERLEYTDTYTINAPIDAYVLFVTSYCLDRCKEQEELQFATRWVAVRDGATDRTFAQTAEK